MRFIFSPWVRFSWLREGQSLEVNCLITAGRDVPLTAYYKDNCKRLSSVPDLVHLLKTACLMGGLHFEVLQYNVYDHIYLTVSSPFS